MTNMTTMDTTIIPLTALAPGEYGQLVQIQGSQALHKRLHDLGLTIGSPVRVVQGDPWGGLILALKNDARLAIGTGVAQKIMISFHKEA